LIIVNDPESDIEYNEDEFSNSQIDVIIHDEQTNEDKNILH
jgi:hypothetical protein